MGIYQCPSKTRILLTTQCRFRPIFPFMWIAFLSISQSTSINIIYYYHISFYVYYYRSHTVYLLEHVISHHRNETTSILLLGFLTVYSIRFASLSTISWQPLWNSTWRMAQLFPLTFAMLCFLYLQKTMWTNLRSEQLLRTHFTRQASVHFSNLPQVPFI